MSGAKSSRTSLPIAIVTKHDRLRSLPDSGMGFPVRLEAVSGVDAMSEWTLNRAAIALLGQAEKNAVRWNRYKCSPAEYLLVATEELGEVAEAMQSGPSGYQWPPEYSDRVREELIDLGAVIIAMIVECGEE